VKIVVSDFRQARSESSRILIGMSSHPFAIVAIDPLVADRLRAGGGEVYVADAKPSYPCRQCLRDAEIGEELILVSYDPFEASGTTSPYRSASPIFLHREMCTPYSPEPKLPEQLTCRTLSVRAFDADEKMVDAAIIQGDTLAETLDGLLANGEVHHIHVHNASRGCFAARVDRAMAARA
jgi:hypothetical protein